MASRLLPISQSKVDSQWLVLTANAGLSGDVLFLKGAGGHALDVDVGKSYEDRGVRNDDHDFFGVAMAIPMTEQKPRWRQRRGLNVIKTCVLKFRGCVLRGGVLRVRFIIAWLFDIIKFQLRCGMIALRTAPARPSPYAF